MLIKHRFSLPVITLMLALAGGTASAIEVAPGLIELAKSGDREAQYQLGLQLTLGDAGEVERGVGWLSKAADQLHYEAANQLGKMYVSGLGVPLDPEAGRRWFARATEIAERTRQTIEDCY